MMGAIAAGTTSIPMDYSGGEYYDPNGGGMVETYSAFTPASQLAISAPDSVTSDGTASLFTAALQLGTLSVPYWLIAIPLLFWIAKGVR